MKNLDCQRFSTFRVGNCTVTGLDSESFKLITGTMSMIDKFVIIPFAGLRDFVDALQQCLNFVQNFEKVVKLREHVLYTQELRLLRVPNYNTSHRLLNSVRLITLFNDMSATRNIRIPYTYVIGDIVNQIRNGPVM